jgi:hypothetical protein
MEHHQSSDSTSKSVADEKRKQSIKRKSSRREIVIPIRLLHLLRRIIINAGIRKFSSASCGGKPEAANFDFLSRVDARLMEF